MTIGRHELNYYTVCGGKTTQGDDLYWVVWLGSGGQTGGYNTAQEARNGADNIVDHCKATPGLCAEKL